MSLTPPYGWAVPAEADAMERRVELLFIGIDWIRKGGGIAVAALDTLRAKGCDARLTVVGRCPEGHKSHPAIRAVGFLNKNRRRDAQMLAQLYRDAHLLVLPTRADCAPMVIAEAMAHGTPVLATDTGGNGAGQLLAPHTDPAAWAAAIHEMTTDPMRYAFLSDAARDCATDVLSWDAWGNGIVTLANQIVQRIRIPDRRLAVS